MLKKCYNNLNIPKSIDTFGFKEDVSLFALYLCAIFYLLRFSYSLTIAMITELRKIFIRLLTCFVFYKNIIFKSILLSKDLLSCFALRS